MAKAHESNLDKCLPELFQSILAICDFLEITNESSVSETVQSKVRQCLDDGKQAIMMVNELRLFSDNEDLEELATADVKYILLPALLAYCTGKDMSQERSVVVKRSQALYRDYLRMCSEYSLTDAEVWSCDTDEKEDKREDRVPPRHGMPDMAAMSKQRQQKIERFKQQKKNEQELKELREYVEKDHVDDEIKRKYYRTLIERWIMKSQEDLESLKDEVSILEHMSKMRAAGEDLKKPPPPQPKKKLQPLILTKDTLQKQVFGLGYPGLPTYTVDEWFDQQLAAGNVPQPGVSRLQAAANDPEGEAELQDKEAAEKEAAEERDEEEALQKARQWDDWKDDHRRGWGNTDNKG